MNPVFLGMDLGTSGLRLVALDDQGNLLTQQTHHWDSSVTDPQSWLGTLELLMQNLQHQLPPGYAVVAVSACSTSGTVLPVDQQGSPLDDALLYQDPRGQAEAQRLGIPASWGLSRWLWWIAAHPELSQQAYLAHPTDFLLCQLGGPTRITDHTCALKSGFDLETYRWPADWMDAYGIRVDRLPQVVSPGTVIGSVSPEWNLGSQVLIVAGITDGCAGQLATGAIAVGQVSTSLGTTLIFKGCSSDKLASADGSVYCHLHPDRSGWLPGAASSCGGGILNACFPAGNFAQLDQQATVHLPTGYSCYPLWQPGERFPIANPNWRGRLPPFDRTDPRFYAALLEGVAFVERLGVDRLQQLGLQVQGSIATTGGGCRSPLWLELRASILNRDLLLPQWPQPAVGSAILAAAGWWQCSVAAAVKRLVRVGQVISPRPDWASAYADLYQGFLQDVAKG
jgi:xylulokinase